jgi:SpoVK/Ycf46/Vps4 family AAA+-type ATPase
MLPKLHDLHERGHCLIILATNDQHRIDPAVMRPGRFDYWLEVLHPSAERVLQYLRNDLENARFVAELHLSQAQFAEARAAVETWIQGLTNPQKKQIPFAVAEAAMRSARSVPPPWDQMKEALKWWANSSRSYRQPGNDVTPPLLSTVVLAPS